MVRLQPREACVNLFQNTISGKIISGYTIISPTQAAFTGEKNLISKSLLLQHLAEDGFRVMKAVDWRHVKKVDSFFNCRADNLPYALICYIVPIPAKIPAAYAYRLSLIHI